MAYQHLIGYDFLKFDIIYSHTIIMVSSNSYFIDMVNELDCDIIVNEFEFHSRNCVHFQTNTLWKGMKPLIPPAIS